jgi:hypothetical protein
LATVTGLAAPQAPQRKLTKQQRIELIRGLMAEFATAAIPIPRSKRPLVVQSDGGFDKRQWDSAGREYGPAARAGDAVQITKLDIKDDRLTIELNHGSKGGAKWYERIELGTGTRTTPIGGAEAMGRPAPGGTSIALVLPSETAKLTSGEVKEMLAPVLKFKRGDPQQSYIDTLPEPIKQAIRDKKAIEGMNRDQVVLAMGKPERKVRETMDGEEVEDWVYGRPPGRITFVTFQGETVLRVKESYAGLGGAMADPLPDPR